MDEACDLAVTLHAVRMVHLANTNAEKATTILTDFGIEMDALQKIFQEETDDGYEVCDMEFPNENWPIDR